MNNHPVHSRTSLAANLPVWFTLGCRKSRDRTKWRGRTVGEAPPKGWDRRTLWRNNWNKCVLSFVLKKKKNNWIHIRYWPREKKDWAAIAWPVRRTSWTKSPRMTRRTICSKKFDRPWARRTQKVPQNNSELLGEGYSVTRSVGCS